MKNSNSSSPPLETLVAPPVQTPPSNENSVHETLAAMNIPDLCFKENQMKKKVDEDARFVGRIELDAREDDFNEIVVKVVPDNASTKEDDFNGEKLWRR